MNKTVYLRPADVAVWEKARELSGDKLSPVILSSLRAFIDSAEAKSRGFERILMEFEDLAAFGIHRRKAFSGRWLISPENPYVILDRNFDFSESFAVAETPKGNVVVFQRCHYSDGREGGRFYVFASFEEAAAKPDLSEAVLRAYSVRGVPL